MKLTGLWDGSLYLGTKGLTTLLVENKLAWGKDPSMSLVYKGLDIFLTERAY